MSDDQNPAINVLFSEPKQAGADLDSSPLLVTGLKSAAILTPDGEIMTLPLNQVADYLGFKTPVLVNRSLVARRLGLPRLKAFDLLELFAFTRPARFCLPTVVGLANALTLDVQDKDLESQLSLVIDARDRLFADLRAETYRYRAGAVRLAEFMARGGWPWGPYVLNALHETPAKGREEDGFAVWNSLKEWEDQAPPPPPGDEPVSPEDAITRLESLLGAGAEKREGQKRYAGAATYSFTPRQFDEGPNIQLLEAGTGTGKTLGYLAPSSRWAEINKGPVWLATYTKALQRQLDGELDKLYPKPAEKRQKAVIRKGRENYLCLLNLEETARAVMSRLTGGYNDDPILIGLVLRWARFTRDGDMIGGDFPSWLGAHFGLGRISGLTDRRGECIYSSCQHYGKCFIEKAVRRSRYADLVVANHALLIANMVNRAGDPDLPKRVVFDEGHHLFDSADSAFATILSGAEGADLRRWLRGKEQGGSTRARGLKNRLEDLINGENECQDVLRELIDAAHILPSDGWLSRLSNATPNGVFETFLSEIRAQIFRRSTGDDRGYGLEVPIIEPDASLLASADQLGAKLSSLEKPFVGLAKALASLLSEEVETFETADKARLENMVRSIMLRSDQIRAWRAALEDLMEKPDPSFVSWFALDRVGGKERDIGLHRHFVDPAEPFANLVLKPMHGSLITSATLRDHANEPVAQSPEITKNEALKAETISEKTKTAAHQDERSLFQDWAGADLLSGIRHLDVAARRLKVSSPFDYRAATKIIVVNDINRDDANQVANAYRALIEAANGGVLGLFTAIARLRAAHDRLGPMMEEKGFGLYAQHVDPIDVGTLVDMFRDDRNSVLLGTDAVRDGVDVPGESLRMIIYDRVPWPRPTLLHKARREHFGARDYDDMITRLKISQAYGRLIRRQDDRGLFIMLDGRAPSRLLDALPNDVDRLRVGLKEAVAVAKDFYGR